MKRNKIFEKKNSYYFKQEGYTIVEILLVTLVIGLTFSISLPLFGAVINKARQKEATLIVNSVIKAVKANYSLTSFLPTKKDQRLAGVRVVTTSIPTIFASVLMKENLQ